MLSTLLPWDASTSSAPALITESEQLDWRELLPRVDDEMRRLSFLAGRRVGLTLAPSIPALVGLIALSRLECHVFLLAEDTPPAQRAAWAVRFGWAHTIAVVGGPLRDVSVDGALDEPAGDEPPPHPSHGRSPGAVTILTSGTSGEPKAVEHTWGSLARPVRLQPGSQPRWLLTYRPHLYAGLQVLLQCLMNRGALVMPASGSGADEVAALCCRFDVEFASATPSYWRWLLAFADMQLLSRIPLRQITLGGEVADQAILDALHRVFPRTRIVHIYATTELGRCFSVTDGREGFPASYLEHELPDGVELRVENDELLARSANAMRGYDGSTEDSPKQDEEEMAQANPWFATGDLVQCRGDRVYFVGRRSDIINVGGNKVHPLEVERVIRGVPGVADVRIYGRPSSLVGQIVACELVVAENADPNTVETAAREITLSSLAPHERPRLFAVVAEIPRTLAGKTQRGT